MNTDECRHEAQILEAFTTGVWTDELASHARDCPDCAELVEVDRALQAESRIAIEETGLPEAALIWRRFELESEQRRVSEATLPIRVLEKLAFTAGLVVALYVLVVSWPVLGTWLLGAGSSLKGSLGTLSLKSMPDLKGPAFMVLGLIGLLGVFLHGLYAQWAES